MVPADSYRISRVPHYSGAASASLRIRLRDCHLLWSNFPIGSTSSALAFIGGPSTPFLPKQERFGLFRVRSPLLAESLLFSFPVGNEMFQFPTFAHCFAVCRLPTTGCPIRRSTGQRIFAPYRSFSQLITSFFAFESLGILHAPLLTFFPRTCPLLYNGHPVWCIPGSLFCC